MIKKVQVFKRDKWNMINVEIHGKTIILNEISEQWGEESHSFPGRPAMMQWVEERFSPTNFLGSEAERIEIINTFKQI